MQTWFQAVCKTGIFIICSQVLVHCRPDSSYEKYLKMLVSIMILLQFLAPIDHILTGEGMNAPGESLRWFQEQLGDGEEIERVGEMSASVESSQGKEIKQVRIAPVRWEAEDHAEE